MKFILGRNPLHIPNLLGGSAPLCSLGCGIHGKDKKASARADRRNWKKIRGMDE